MLAFGLENGSADVEWHGLSGRELLWLHAAGLSRGNFRTILPPAFLSDINEKWVAVTEGFEPSIPFQV